MVFPLHDDNPTTTRPYVTVGILIACVLAYAWQHLLLSKVGAAQATQAFGMVPAMLTGLEVLPADALIPPWATIFTWMFIHQGFWHLAGNLIFLWIFGNNVEEAMGHVRFFIFYVACGVVAVIAQVVPDPASMHPLVGASGPVSGVLGAYMLLFPRARVLLGLPLGFLNIEFGRFPAVWVIAAWFSLPLLIGAIAASQSAGESQFGGAFAAHVGGFVAGLALVTIFKRRDVRLWRRH